jgi:glycosyltransferase involved in cell wall biosynthesis
MHLLWQFGRRTCETRHCLWCCLRGRRPPQPWRATGLLGRRVRQIDRFLAPSRFVRDKHRELGMDLPTTVLPYFLPDAPPAAPDDAPPHRRPYFLFVGRLERIKGLHTVYESFRRPGAPDLVVAGEGTEGQNLRAAAADMPNVTFLGAQDFSRLRALYRHAIAVVVPSVCYEVFPMVILEAFAESTPVVARDHSGMAEAVNDSGGGLLFDGEADLQSALDRLRGDPGLRRALGDAGRRTFLERWTADAHVRKYLEIVRECREAKASSRGAQSAAPVEAI